MKVMRYRKKPVVVEAIRLTRESLDSVIEFVVGDHEVIAGISGGAARIGINTLEGRMTANEGDWIIKGVAGEFYPCKDDIFRATYELELPHDP